MKFDYKLLSKYRDILMGIAIIGILFCHYNECRSLAGLSGTILSKTLAYGTAFVDVFLVLSGLGLYYSFSKNKNIAAFYKKRFLRILPTYLIIALPYWIYKDIFVEGLGFVDILYDICFGSMLIDGVHRFWFVFAIILFYLLFPLIYKGLSIIKKHDELSLLLCLFISVAGGVILRIIIPELYSNIRIAIDRIPAFIVGIYAGRKCEKGETLKPVYVVIVMAATVVMEILLKTDNIFSSFIGFFYYYVCTMLGCSILILLCWAIDGIEKLHVGAEGVIFKSLETLGTVTLEAYLLHSAFKNIANYPANFGAYIIVAVILPIPVAFLVHYICGKIVPTKSMR